jgi:hypothetical protein
VKGNSAAAIAFKEVVGTAVRLADAQMCVAATPRKGGLPGKA